ncbi:DUF1800 family protein [Vibrio mediterranei]|uniref:DUF1800 family protein n=1 Tax=Vibrio mediterranei TaxID=689 RepID=UPI0038CF229E
MKILNSLSIIVILTSIVGCNDNSSESPSSPPPPTIELDICSEQTSPEPFDVYRFSQQATLGASNTQLRQIQQSTNLCSWIDAQIAMPIDFSYLEATMNTAHYSDPNNPIFNHSHPDFNGFNNSSVTGQTGGSFDLTRYQSYAWWEGTLESENLLRNRIAYALSQLLVVSDSETPLHRRAESLAYFYDILYANAFGNYREILKKVALSPTMGVFLSHNGNQKHTTLNDGSIVRPDENFAREIMQLFSLGLNQLNLDGSIKTDVEGNPIPTYSLDDVIETSRVLTGWYIDNDNYNGKGENFGRANYNNGQYSSAMIFDETYHDNGTKTILGTTIPPGQTVEQDLDSLIDILMASDNIAPHISTFLISQLVTANPSPTYIADIATVFNNNGEGIKGDLASVVKAILVHPEARNSSFYSSDSYGRAKEPVFIIADIMKKFSAQKLPGIPTKNGNTFKSNSTEGIYGIINPNVVFGYGPMRSPTVFNFYPSDKIYNIEGISLLAPSLDLYTDSSLAKLTFYTRAIIQQHPYELIMSSTGEMCDGKPCTSLFEWGQTWGPNNESKVVISYEEEIALLTSHLNGDLTNITDSQLRQPAIRALIEHLNTKLVGNTLPIDLIEELVSHFVIANPYPIWQCREGQIIAYQLALECSVNTIADAVQTIMFNSYNLLQR